MKIQGLIVGAAMLLVSLGAAAAQEDRVMKAFEHYEAIRVVLAGDEIKNIADHAAALMPLADEIGGPNAKKAAEGLRTATNLKHAREHFGSLSAALVPESDIEGRPFLHVLDGESVLGATGQGRAESLHGKVDVDLRGACQTIGASAQRDRVRSAQRITGGDARYGAFCERAAEPGCGPLWPVRVV